MSHSALKIFSLLFGAMYILSFYMEWALFRYYPETAQFRWRNDASLGPAILWYGWMATAFLISAVPALLVPKSLGSRIPPSWLWIVPVVITVVTLIHERRFFV